MFGIGGGELVVIVIILILAVGPDRMPKLMRTLGQGMRQFRQKSQELREAVGIDDLLYGDPAAPRLAPAPHEIVAHQGAELSDADVEQAPEHVPEQVPEQAPEQAREHEKS